MRTIRSILLALLAVPAATLADGMIVPVRPDLKVSGNWAVKYHHVRMLVRDQVAAVTITQEFVNTASGMIEVEYLFPVPPGAAIDNLTLSVDGKEFAGKLLKADEARKIYEEIVRRKKDPALLEYAGFGLYRTRAFPLEPGKPAKVIVHYSYICRKDAHLTEVWYPLNTEKFSAKPIQEVQIIADIKADADITSVYSPSHSIDIKRNDARHVLVTHTQKDTTPGTDFSLFFRTSDQAVSASLLSHRGDPGKDGYFMMLVSPNPRQADQAVIAKDVILVLDRSGSMGGEKIEQARSAGRFIVGNLNPEDRFNVITYSDTVEWFFDTLTDAKPERIKEAHDRLDRMEAAGATNIHDALAKAMKMVSDRGESSRPAYVIFVTDGLPTVGDTNESNILANTRKLNQTNARLFGFGVGYDVNIRLLDKLAGENAGKSDYAKPKENIEGRIAALYTKIRHPVMTRLSFRMPGVAILDSYPRELGDLFEGDQIIVLGRYRPEGQPDAPTLRAQLVVTGQYAGKDRGFEYPVELAVAKTGDRLAFVEKLWATRRIGWLLDQIQLNGQSKEVIDELVRLSMQYGIITPYTSFLADDTVALHQPDAIQLRASQKALSLGKETADAAGQVHAMNRQALNEARVVTSPTAPSGAAPMAGFASVKGYEANERASLESVRQIGQQALFRRGNTWTTPELARQDIQAQADKAVSIERFSEKYFELVRANTVQQNQVLSSQREGEELLIELRGQVYRIR